MRGQGSVIRLTSALLLAIRLSNIVMACRPDSMTGASTVVKAGLE